MNIPPVKGQRTDPVSRAQKAYSQTSGEHSLSGVKAPAPRDRLNISDEARLREEYALRLMQAYRQEGGPSAADDSRHALEKAARLYADFFDEIRLHFRGDPAASALHATALDSAWEDMLDILAGQEADRLVRRESPERGGSAAGLSRELARVHRRFGDAFRAVRPLSGTDRAVLSAMNEAAAALEAAAREELAMTDIMALLYYRKSFER